jgi:hypothetical protein
MRTHSSGQIVIRESALQKNYPSFRDNSFSVSLDPYPDRAIGFSLRVSEHIERPQGEAPRSSDSL